MLTPTGGQPVLYENYTGELIDWDDFFKKREEHIELMKDGSELPACKGCLWIKNANWDERKKELRYILLNIWVKCNLYCVYCSNHTDTNVINNTKEYDIIPVLKDMVEKGVITPNTKIDIAGGESTLDPKFNELLAFLLDSGIKNININTNATIFSESIYRGIEKGYVSIISSIDAGSAQKFEFIKKKNLWNKVWNNLEKYSSAKKIENSNFVKAKYIIIPNINSTKHEILKFILKSKKANVSGIILNIDLNWLRQNNNDTKTMSEIIELAKYFIKISNLVGIDWQIWAHIEDLIKRYNMLNEGKEIDISFIFDKTKKELTFTEKLQKLFLKFQI